MPSDPPSSENPASSASDPGSPNSIPASSASNPLAPFRREYEKGGLLETGAAANPFDQFQKWFEEAAAFGVREPNAMTLATADSRGRPSARMVLLKDFGERGFAFFTHYASRKGRELDANPFAALLFFWPELERQIRIEGSVEKLPEKESDAYYAQRPEGSRLAAWAAQQSAILQSREELDRRYQEIAQRFSASGGANFHPAPPNISQPISCADPRPIPRPPQWGGFLLRPEAFEFWQGRPNRLHDRLRYRLAPGPRWLLDRLAP